MYIGWLTYASLLSIEHGCINTTGTFPLFRCWWKSRFGKCRTNIGQEQLYVKEGLGLLKVWRMDAWGRFYKVERDFRENGAYTDSESRFSFFIRHKYTSCYAVRILITLQMDVNLIFTIVLWDFVHFGFWIYKFQSVFFRSLRSLSRSLGLLFGAWYKMEHYSGNMRQSTVTYLVAPGTYKGERKGPMYSR